MKRTLKTAVAILAVGLLGLAACGDDGDDQSSDVAVTEAGSAMPEAPSVSEDNEGRTINERADNSAGADTVWQYDINGDGWYDAYLMDRYQDGVADYTCYDSNQNGLVEMCMADLNNDQFNEIIMADQGGNGVFDAFTLDSDLDGWADILYLDNNENGVLDSAESSFVRPEYNTVVGPVTNAGWFYNIMTLGAQMGADVAYGEGDFDGDGWVDSEDYHPSDAGYH